LNSRKSEAQGIAWDPPFEPQEKNPKRTEELKKKPKEKPLSLGDELGALKKKIVQEEPRKKKGRVDPLTLASTLD